MKHLPEYRNPLGPPKGPAQKIGYIYKRSFKHADVSLNLSKEIATIHWKLND